MEKKSVKKDRHLSMRAMFLVMVTIVFAFVPVVSVQGDDEPNIVRHEGYSRDNVAENVAKAHFSDSNKVILVNREKFPDAISATNISQGKYPVLYTHAGHVTEGTIQTLQSMSLDEIYILGGTLSISDAVAEQLKQETGVKVTRVAGRSRYDANVEAIKENFTQENHVVIASGEVFSDALYGVSYANTIDAPVVLTKTNQLEASTIQLLKDLGANQATIIGGALTVTPEVEKQLSALGISHDRIAGRNRYIGSAEVANAAYQNPANAVIASGEVFSDALVSAPLAQKLDAPILLVRPESLEKAVEDYLATHMASLENIYIQGGPLTITKENEENIAKAGQVKDSDDFLEDITFDQLRDDELYGDQNPVINTDPVQDIHFEEQPTLNNLSKYNAMTAQEFKEAYEANFLYRPVVEEGEFVQKEYAIDEGLTLVVEVKSLKTGKEGSKDTIVLTWGIVKEVVRHEENIETIFRKGQYNLTTSRRFPEYVPNNVLDKGSYTLREDGENTPTKVYIEYVKDDIPQLYLMIAEAVHEEEQRFDYSDLLLYTRYGWTLESDTF